MGVVCLSGCVDPVDLAAFTKDKDVVENIEKGSSVDLTIDSEPGLEKGYQKITGLDPGKYYAVVEWEVTNGVTSLVGGGVQFVRASGALSAAVGDIGAVTGGEITGLSNDRHYQVKAAQSLEVAVEYTDYVTPAGDTITPTAGIIELPRPTGHDISYHLKPKFSDANPLLPPVAEYQIAEISADGSSRPAARALDGSIITTISAETVVHYVLFRQDTKLSTTIAPVYEFYVLKIGVGLPPPEGSITINFYKNDGTSFVHATRYVRPGYSIDLEENLTMPTAPLRTGYTFDGWWTKDGTSDGIWDTQFTKDTIVAVVPNPRSVYAKWVADGPGGQGNINITVNITYSTDTPFNFTFADTNGPIPNISAYQINQDDPKDVTITISNANVFTGATFTWYYNGTPFLPPQSPASTCTVPFSTNIDYLLPGKHTFYVEAEIGSIPTHSGWVEIQVNVP